MNWSLQVLTVTTVFLRSIPQRLGSSIAAAVGVAGVVGVMVAVLSIGVGFSATLRSTGAEDAAIVLRSGSDSELSSGLSLDATRIIADAPGVARGPGGPIASAEMYVILDLPKRGSGTEANVPLRGVQPAAYDVRQNVRVVAGRRPTPGRNEILAGVGAVAEFEGLELGRKLEVAQEPWEIVGHFEADGSLAESELWTDVAVLQPAYRRGNTYQSVHLKLESPEAFEAFKDALTTDPRLNVNVERERDYYAEQSEVLSSVVTRLGIPVVLLMSVGAVFGALNTMYSSVAARTREVATLRALGFGGGPVVISVLVESLVLSLAGGIVGAAVAYLLFNGYRAATLNWQSFSQVVFQFQVTPGLMTAGIVLALTLGFFAGLLPAIRAARIPVASALREL